jgi:hypothetical protein
VSADDGAVSQFHCPIKLIFLALVSLVAAAVAFYGAMFMTMAVGAVFLLPQAERNLGFGMLLLTVGLPIWLLAGIAAGIVTFKKLRSRLFRAATQN